MAAGISKISIEGFKSIKRLKDFPLGQLNILIGANGSGKSNLVDFFRMLRAMADQSFQAFVNSQGGDGFFFNGPQFTRKIQCRLEFGQNVYEFDLTPNADGSIQIEEERGQYVRLGLKYGGLNISKGVRESRLKDRKDERGSFGGPCGIPHYIFESISNWVVYHFHDTSALAPMRREHSLRDNDFLRADASNLAAFLLRLKVKHPDSYSLIRDTVRLIAPFFDDFRLKPIIRNDDEFIRLEWMQKGSNYPFQPSQLSDGTIRFIGLATALLQPKLPATIVIDEPELGLHPYAIGLLAELMKSSSKRTQVIVSTQSVTLLDQFDASDIVIVNREDGASTFTRLDAEGLADWLADYSIGELWQKNVVRGGPSHE